MKTSEQTIWFHGTTAKNALEIVRSGFREGTYFARHMEDAVTYGGPVVFFVKVQFDLADWQACSSNALPRETIQKICYVSTL